MTAVDLVHSNDERDELNCSPWSPPLKSIGSKSRKRPRTSSLSSSSTSRTFTSARSILPPYPPNNKNSNANANDNDNANDSESAAAVELGLTRPQTALRPRTSGSFRHDTGTQLPYIHHAGEKGSHFREAIVATHRSGKKHVADRVAWEGDGNSSEGEGKAGGSDGTQLSKSAKLMEEDRKKVASIRSFLLNFLEERDCSIKKRLDLCVHQTETGRPVTDAVVQEVCKLRPDMIGLSLRDCVEVTDVGLWCVARHTTALRELNVSGCNSITNIGLRSLAICCDKMEQLDFTGCTRLTDVGLRVIGGGCWDLKSLSLESCPHVSDTGVAELAKMCTGLTYLNISRCERVGEYGDRALIQLGRSCHQLKGLDAFGCSHAQDPGLLAVARGCPKLEKLMLTGCGSITGKSVRALARGCVSLRDLSLSGCGGVGNGDLRELAKGCKGLRHLNIAECAQVNAHGLAGLASGLKNLTELDVGGCERVDDSALRALCSMNAQFLNLSGCAAITETGVAGIAMNCTALSSLNVTGCPGIGRRFMAELCHSMQLSEPAQAFFGFQPRKNAKELLAKADERKRRMYAAVRVQAHMRGRLARGRTTIVRRNWIVKTRLSRAQAIIRGYFARKWYRAWRAQVREQRAAAAIQATWRMLGDRRTVERRRADKLFREKGHVLATHIQAGWWGYRGRVRMKEIRAVRARRLLLEARVQARRELCSIVIQSNTRGFFARNELRRLKGIRDKALELEAKRQAAAVLIQSVARMRTGRAVLKALKAARDRKILEWEMALRVQAAWRGKEAKIIVNALRIVREIALQKAAATTIQSFWRAVRAVHLTKIQRAMFKVRQMQAGASKEIQRVYRGFKGRLRAKARKNVFKSDLGREAAAMDIERIFRGHKGRERFECKQHLRALEDQARPLLLKLDELSESAEKVSKRLRHVSQAVGPLRAEHTTLREELFHIRHTKNKYTDSDKINGCRQRFLTKFLQVRLVEVQDIVEKRVKSLEAEAIELEVKERYTTRLLRQVERELIPLGTGTVEKVKLLRTARLRKKVRSERRGATTIQTNFRGWRVRKAISSWYRDYWIESEDKATGDVYYVNTWNQEIRWSKPLEMSLFEDPKDKQTARPGTPGASTTTGFDADTFDDGVGSIGSRFAQLYGQLADKATHAAEEEAGMMRYVEATTATTQGGGDMLAAASEWTFVSTDSRLSRARCWYRARTSEYFWGNIPPMLSAAKSPAAARDTDSGGNAGGTSGGGGGGGVDPGRAVVGFPDRAAGEAWLKTQDIPSLLEKSETVRGIGPSGWRQLRAAPPLPDNDGTASQLTISAEEANSSVNSVAVPSTTASSSGITGRNLDHRGGADSLGQECNRHHQQQLGGGGAPTDLASPTSLTSLTSVASVANAAEVATETRALCSSPSFTFFHHAEMRQVRWCLSPRSALATPRTPRRQASLSRLATYNPREDIEDEENLENSDVTLVPGGSSWDSHSGVAGGTLRDNNPGDNEWEVVEDGDMVFYYNRISGTSTWDPPPGWEQSGGGADDGAINS